MKWFLELLLLYQFQYRLREAALVPILDRPRAVQTPDLYVSIALSELRDLPVRHLHDFLALDVEILPQRPDLLLSLLHFLSLLLKE